MEGGLCLHMVTVRVIRQMVPLQTQDQSRVIDNWDIKSRMESVLQWAPTFLMVTGQFTNQSLFQGEGGVLRPLSCKTCQLSFDKCDEDVIQFFGGGCQSDKNP